MPPCPGWLYEMQVALDDTDSTLLDWAVGQEWLPPAARVRGQIALALIYNAKCGRPDIRSGAVGASLFACLCNCARQLTPVSFACPGHDVCCGSRHCREVSTRRCAGAAVVCGNYGLLAPLPYNDWLSVLVAKYEEKAPELWAADGHPGWDWFTAYGCHATAISHAPAAGMVFARGAFINVGWATEFAAELTMIEEEAFRDELIELGAREVDRAFLIPVLRRKQGRINTQDVAAWTLRSGALAMTLPASAQPDAQSDAQQRVLRLLQQTGARGAAFAPYCAPVGLMRGMLHGPGDVYEPATSLPALFEAAAGAAADAADQRGLESDTLCGAGCKRPRACIVEGLSDVLADGVQDPVAFTESQVAAERAAHWCRGRDVQLLPFPRATIQLNSANRPCEADNAARAAAACVQPEPRAAPGRPRPLGRPGPASMPVAPQERSASEAEWGVASRSCNSAAELEEQHQSGASGRSTMGGEMRGCGDGV